MQSHPKNFALIALTVIYLLTPSAAFALTGAIHQPIEIPFQSQHATPPANAFDYANVRLEVELQGPQGKTQTVPGFWDGGKTWKVRVNLPITGTWTYRSNFRGYADNGLQGKVGTITVSGPLNNKATAVHGGILNFNQTSKRIEYRDGTEFKWIADTWWWFPKNFDKGDFLSKATQDRAEKDFTVIQSHGLDIMLQGADGRIDLSPFRNGVALPIWSQFDDQVQQVHDAGLVLFLGFGTYCKLQQAYFRTQVGRETIKNLFAYVLARYGAHNTSFLFTQEYNQHFDSLRAAVVDPTTGVSTYPYGICPPYARVQPHPSSGRNICMYDEDVYQQRISLLNELGLLVRAEDPYKRALTIHSGTHENQILGAPAQEWSWVDFILLQRGHLIQHAMPSDYADYIGAGKKPFIEGEFNYEGFGRGFNTSHPFIVKMPVVVEDAAIAMQAGSLGITYGAQGLYVSVYDEAEISSSGIGRWGLPITMSQAVDSLTAPKHLRHVLDAFREFPAKYLKPLARRMAYVSPSLDLCAQNWCRTHVSGGTDASGVERYVALFQRTSGTFEETYLRVAKPNGNYRIRSTHTSNGVTWYDEVQKPAFVLANTNDRKRIANPLTGYYLKLRKTPQVGADSSGVWIITVISQ